MDRFRLVSPYKATGDQPEAIDALVKGIMRGDKEQALVGVTGSGKTFTMASIIEKVNRPTLVLAHNKTLAAQLCSEFREFFPDNAVSYFVSYYDYYQPEAYIPGKDLYIEKDSLVNDEIDRLRHSATSSLFERRDVIIVASVSCIYSLGDPSEYKSLVVAAREGMAVSREELMRRLITINYTRNDFSLTRDKFRARGDTLEIMPASDTTALRIEFFGDEIDRISEINVLTGEVRRRLSYAAIYPASHYATSEAKRDAALDEINREMLCRVEEFKAEGKFIEAQRIEERTKYDMEMIREIGFCSGIENYSRVLSGRPEGSVPFCLIDYFPRDFLLLVDESHVTLPQVRAMSGGDFSRKKNLIDYGFRLPSAYDNRPLTFSEFEKKLNQVIYVSATPGPYEKEHCTQLVEQIIRPTGLLDPKIEIRPVKGQVDDLMGEIKKRTEKGERVLVTTLTKKMAEDLCEYLEMNLIKVRYIHHEVETMERQELLRDLRLGVYDVLVGINLLREGLDLPEVSLVAVLDADKEGLLRSETALIQTIGRAARNENGTVIMYADTVTASMQRAISETERRRSIQQKYNEEHGIIPHTIKKDVRAVIEIASSKEINAAKSKKNMSAKQKEELVARLTTEMKKAASQLDFERAAYLRDSIAKIKNTENK
ncbi:MAG: excinuclease ABC subunit UvrB [Eubacteriales bacterium]|nr:excinuclease ABC subunit UvrB [Eubacterium sp.]MDY5494324.1 excinuclease ABC subunit UvrB [Eubacteriales bacterium]